MAEPHEKHHEKYHQPRGGETMMITSGISWPAVFTGWVVAFFSGLVLSALAGAIFTGLGTTPAAGATLGIAGGVVGLVIWFLAFFFGGWICGRIAAMNGPLHGLMVWVIGLVFLILLYILAAIIGSGVALIGGITVPTAAGNLAAIVSIAGGVLLAVQLLGALIGGWLGARNLAP